MDENETEKETIISIMRAADIRDQALTYAMDYARLKIGEPSPEAVVDAARVFEAYLSGEGQKTAVMHAPMAPAVPIDESLQGDGIVCLEDGKKFQMMKRHLRVEHGLTPDELWERWGLPPDYPMVASKYSVRRGDIAKATGLGKNKDPKAAE